MTSETTERIIDLAVEDSINENKALVLDDEADGTKKLTLAQLRGFLNADDLAAIQREVMASYGYFGIEQNLDELMALVRAEKWSKFAIGDYVTLTNTDGEKIEWEVVAKNHYLHSGDTALEKPHIVLQPRNCLVTEYKYNTSNTNTGGYAASLMPANLETEYEKLPNELKAYITTVRRLENNKGGWAWASRRIFLPSVPEVTGGKGWADQYSGGSPIQLPIFVGGKAHAMKGRGYQKGSESRTWYWLADPSEASTTYFCYFSSNGLSTYSAASDEGGVAPLIVLS